MSVCVSECLLFCFVFAFSLVLGMSISCCISDRHEISYSLNMNVSIAGHPFNLILENTLRKKGLVLQTGPSGS